MTIPDHYGFRGVMKMKYEVRLESSTTVMSFSNEAHHAERLSDFVEEASSRRAFFASAAGSRSYG